MFGKFTFGEFLEAVEEMEKTGLIEHVLDDQTVKLTPKGANWLSMLQAVAEGRV